MGKLLKREFTIKIKLWELLLDIVLGAIIFNILFGFLIAKCGNDVINVINWLNTDNLVFDFCIMMFPAFLIIAAVLKLEMFAISYDKGNVSVNKKTSKK